MRKRENFLEAKNYKLLSKCFHGVFLEKKNLGSIH